MPLALIHADGASSGNPGPSGIGAVVKVGGHLKEIAENIGTATNNIAEYTALIRGLEEALKLGAREATIRMDSELVVRQIQGRYKVKNEGLRPLYEKAVALLKRFKRYDIEHVPREENKEADALSKRGLTAKASAPAPAKPAPSAPPTDLSGSQEGLPF